MTCPKSHSPQAADWGLISHKWNAKVMSRAPASPQEWGQGLPQVLK